MFSSSSSHRAKKRFDHYLTTEVVPEEHNHYYTSHGFTIKNLTLEVGNGDRRHLLFDDVNLHLSSDMGFMFYYAGPTGSGKSVLLEYIVYEGNLPRGIKKIGGKIDVWAYENIRKVGYVPVNMMFLPYFTVYRYLIFKSRLMVHRMDEKESNRDLELRRHKAVMRVLLDMDIQYLINRRLTHYQDRGSIPIERISQGELKRIQIAVELLSPPAMLILDEPASTLDIYTTISLYKLLTRVCKKYNMTTLVALHDDVPVISNLFDGRLNILSDEEIAIYRDDPNVEGKDIPSPLQSPASILLTVMNRHIYIRSRMLANKFIWTNRCIMLILACMVYWKVDDYSEIAHYFDQKGVSLFLLMHLQYETLYMAQGHLREERVMYANELCSHVYGKVTLGVGRIPAEFMGNFAQAFLFIICLYPCFWGLNTTITGLVLITLAVSLFLLCVGAMWRCTNSLFRDFRKGTWCGDLYINIGLNVSGFWTSLSDIGPLKVLRYVTPLPLTFQVLNQVTISDKLYDNPDGSITSGTMVLLNDGQDIEMWKCFLLLVGIWLFWEMMVILCTNQRVFRVQMK